VNGKKFSGGKSVAAVYWLMALVRLLDGDMVPLAMLRMSSRTVS
jgi:hypothetical protein